jgi:KUP system potassium uptake protein
MMQDGTIPDRSSHPSLRNHNVPPDLKYVIIDNVYINDFLLTIKEKITLNIYNFVKYIGSSDFKAYGLAPHNVLVESVPLMYNPIREDKITLDEFRRYES